MGIKVKYPPLGLMIIYSKVDVLVKINNSSNDPCPYY